MKKKSIALLMAAVMLMGVAIGGTIAWLKANTNPVVNTFTVGDVNIELYESDVDDDNDNQNTTEKDDANAYQLIPGETYIKDPKVEVLGTTNVDCYLFVKFEEIGNPATYLTYETALTRDDGWTPGDGTDIPSNVWYRTVGKDDPVKSWNLLKGKTGFANGYVTIRDTVTKTNMADAAGAQLKWTAYAVQSDNIADAATAWGIVNPAPVTP